jgi:hypothetical protein
LQQLRFNTLVLFFTRRQHGIQQSSGAAILLVMRCPPNQVWYFLSSHLRLADCSLAHVYLPEKLDKSRGGSAHQANEGPRKKNDTPGQKKKKSTHRGPRRPQS